MFKRSWAKYLAGIMICAAVIFTSLLMAEVSSLSAAQQQYTLDDNSNVFSPGYINAAKQKTEAIINGQSRKKSFMENAMDYVKEKLSDKVGEDAVDKPQPDLKKKKGSSEGSGTAVAATETIDRAALSEELQKRMTEINFTNPQDIEKMMRDAQAGGQTVTDLGGRGLNGTMLTTWYENNTAYFKVEKYRWETDEATGEEIMKPTSTLVDKTAFAEGGPGRYSFISAIDPRDGKWTLAVTTYEHNNNDEYEQYSSTQSLRSYDKAGAFTKDDYTSSIRADFKTGDISWNSNTLGNTVLRNTDSNNDGMVDLSDLTIVSANWGETIRQGQDLGSWNIADVNRDGRVDDKDNYLLSRAWTGSDDGAGGIKFSGINSFVSMDKGSDRYTNTNFFITPSSSNMTSNSSWYQRDNYTSIASQPLITFTDRSGKDMGSAPIASILKGLLAGKNDMAVAGRGEVDPALLAKIVDDAMLRSALSIPLGQFKDVQDQSIQLALILSNIINNPTEDQKKILDATQALLNDINKMEEALGSPELKKASDDLLQAVASVLIAQAIPDLFKESDIADIKGIFTELNSQKGKIMLEYQESIRPYYDQVLKELSKNMDMLQSKNILSNNMTREELERLPRSDIDKILAKLNKAKYRSFEEEYILQQEAKYRKIYIEPSNKILDSKMKSMLESFTKRLSGVLESAKTEKK